MYSLSSSVSLFFICVQVSTTSFDIKYETCLPEDIFNPREICRPTVCKFEEERRNGEVERMKCFFFFIIQKLYSKKILEGLDKFFKSIYVVIVLSQFKIHKL